MSEEKKYVTNFTFPNGETFYVKDEETYTKNEIDQKLVGAMTYKGVKATTSELPNSGNQQGDVWHITTDSSEWAWNGSSWEELGKDGDAVLYTPMTLTAAQQEQARSNIAAISKSDLAYVTPEQFGAKGDGETDDTAAIQSAVDTGKNVVFGFGKTYKCGTIHVVKNIEIDCKWAKFICTNGALFDCAGEVTGTVEGADYVGGTVYELPNEDKYTGIAMLTSNDNVITTRNYYYGGFIAEFFDGVCAEKYPVSFAGVTIEKINPVICKILNIGEVTFLEQSGYTYAVKITYGAMCEVNGFNITGDYYSAVTFAKCLNCTAQNITGVSDYSGSQNYPIEFLDSSKCVLNASDIKSAKWTCFSIGGNYLCYNNRIRHSTCITTSAAHGIGSHDNAIGTVIEDCKATGFHLGANGRILNCKNLCNGSGENAKTNIALMCSTIEDISNFVVDGIEFVFQEEGNPGVTSGITLEASGTSGGVEAYARNVQIKNLRTNRADLYTLIRFCNFNTTGASTHLYVNGSIVCDAVVGCYGFTAQMANRVSFGNDSHLVLRNSIEKRPDGKPALLLGANGSVTKYPAKVEVENCYIYSLAGTFGKLRLFNVSTSGNFLTGFSGDYLECSNSCTIHSSTIEAFTSTRFLDPPAVTASDEGKFLRVNSRGAWAAETVPVQSVNGKTGAVTLTASDVGALPSSTSIPTAVSELTNDSGYQTASDVQTLIDAALRAAGVI